MNRRLLQALCPAALAATALLIAVRVPRSAAAGSTWNSSAAAQHLDARQSWWMAWPKASRDHETPCISCHTSVPYALARPSLRQTLGEAGPSQTEQQMLEHIQKRVGLWSELKPFYDDAGVGPHKTAESRGTESVLNALILARYDAARGNKAGNEAKQQLGAITRTAFDNMWSTQLTTGDQAGAWDWLNFKNAPWESNESQYWGATLAAIAIGEAPGDYRKSPAIQVPLQNLNHYLKANYATQPLINQTVVLWAAVRDPDLLTKAQREALLAQLRSRQQQDGGWSLSTLGDWKRKDGTPLNQSSDGYATGLAVYAMAKAGVPHNTSEMKKATAWLIQNQDAIDGQWTAYSVNKQRDPATDVGKFMSDAATSYSVLALEAVSQ